MAKLNRISNNTKAMQPNGKLNPSPTYLIIWGKGKWKLFTKSEEEKNNCIARLKKEQTQFRLIKKL